MAKPPGLPPRRAALKLLDAVLRRGETLEQAGGAANGLRSFSDRALGRAIASEVLRWLVDLDALIDSAPRRSACPTMPRRAWCCGSCWPGWLRLETPPHAVVATGAAAACRRTAAAGARRLRHAHAARAQRCPRYRPCREVAERWGERASASIAAGLAAPPQLDLTLCATWPMQQPLRCNPAGPCARPCAPATRILCRHLPGYEEGNWWAQDLAASLPARLLGAAKGDTRLDLVRRAGWQDHATCRSGLERHFARHDPKRRCACAKTSRAPGSRLHPCWPMRWSGSRGTSSTPSCWMRRAPRPAPAAATPTCSTASASAT